MGTSTDAILFYGFHADEGAWDDSVGQGLDWQEKLAVLAGATRPPSAEYDDSTKDAYKAFWDAQSKAVEEERCEIGSHCSGECPMPYVCVKESKTIAYRGDPMEIKSLEVDPTWNVSLRAFADKMGIPWQPPRWWLVSDWN